jgi:HK97 family phage major capsid protein
MTINEINAKIKNVIDQRAKAWEAAKTFLDTHGSNGVLSAEDAETYDKMEADVSKYTDELNRLNKAKEIEDMLSQPASSPILSNPQPIAEPKRGRASDEYKRAFERALRSNFRNVDTIMQEGVDADGGYLVPEEWDRRLIEALNGVSIMRNLATVITTNGTHKIPIAGTQPAAAWTDEGEAITFDKATFSQAQLDAYKLVVAVKVTEELLYDNAYDLVGYLQRAFASALSNKEEEAFMAGTAAASTPTGIFDATKGGTAYKTLAAAMKADDIVDLAYALDREYRPQASFIMNDKIIAQVRKLKDGSGNFLWQPTYVVDEPDKLLGYNLNTSTYAPETAIAFGDYKYYNIGDRGTRSFAELKELYAGNGMIGYVAKERVDGILTLREAVQILTLNS